MWRGLKEQERTEVRRSLDRWGAFPVAENYKILAKIEPGVVEIFLISPGAFRFVLLNQPYAAGLHIGTLRRRGLRLCLQGAFLVAGESQERVIRVNEKAEALFIYGRDVSGESVIEVKPELEQNSVCVVGNEKGEAIGLGKLLVSGDRLKEHRMVIENITDMGHYLRSENK